MDEPLKDAALRELLEEPGLADVELTRQVQMSLPARMLPMLAGSGRQRCLVSHLIMQKFLRTPLDSWYAPLVLTNDD